VAFHYKLLSHAFWPDKFSADPGSDSDDEQSSAADLKNNKKKKSAYYDPDSDEDEGSESDQELGVVNMDDSTDEDSSDSEGSENDNEDKKRREGSENKEEEEEERIPLLQCPLFELRGDLPQKQRTATYNQFRTASKTHPQIHFILLYLLSLFVCLFAFIYISLVTLTTEALQTYMYQYESP